MSVPAQRAVVRLGDRNLADHAVRPRVDDQRAVRAPARDEHTAPVARHREPVGIRPHVDAADHAVGDGVDDAHRGGAVTADVDLAPVRSHHEAVRPLGDWDGAEHPVLAGVDDGHRIVLEEAHIGLGRSRGRTRAGPERAPAHQGQHRQHHRHALQHRVTSREYSRCPLVPTAGWAIRSPGLMEPSPGRQIPGLEQRFVHRSRRSIRNE